MAGSDEPLLDDKDDDDGDGAILDELKVRTVDDKVGDGEERFGFLDEEVAPPKKSVIARRAEPATGAAGGSEEVD